MVLLKADKGLENIVIDKQSVCLLDTNMGLFYRGISIEDLAKHSNFEEVAYLLLYGELPTKREFYNFKSYLARNRKVPDKIINISKKFRGSNYMSLLRTSVSALGSMNKDKKNITKAKKLIAKMPTIVANIGRVSNGQPPIKPNEELSYAEDFLRMLLDNKCLSSSFYLHHPDIFDKTLILYAEHEFNASTTAAELQHLHCQITSHALLLP